MLENEDLPQGQSIEGSGAGLVQEVRVEARDAPALEITGAMVSAALDLFDKEETNDSFTQLLAEVEASLPLQGDQVRVGEADDQFLAVPMDGSDNLSGDQLAELTLMDVPISEAEDMEVTNVDEGIMVDADDQGPGNGSEQVMGRKKALKGGSLST